jgi:hypothetical protein
VQLAEGFTCLLLCQSDSLHCICRLWQLTAHDINIPHHLCSITATSAALLLLLQSHFLN